MSLKKIELKSQSLKQTKLSKDSKKLLRKKNKKKKKEVMKVWSKLKIKEDELKENKIQKWKIVSIL